MLIGRQNGWWGILVLQIGKHDTNMSKQEYLPCQPCIPASDLDTHMMCDLSSTCCSYASYLDGGKDTMVSSFAW